jgi:ATP-dependent Lon protease
MLILKIAGKDWTLINNELDKSGGDPRYNPMSALHGLLEPRQAKQFKDLSVPELTIDASNLIWIATGNTSDGIEKPILDRFTIFNIEEPTKEQGAVIVTNLYKRFIDNHPSGNIFESDIRDDVLMELSKHHPRKIRKMLNQAFGMAAFNDRTYLTVEDIKSCESGDIKKAGIGFLAKNIK